MSPSKSSLRVRIDLLFSCINRRRSHLTGESTGTMEASGSFAVLERQSGSIASRLRPASWMGCNRSRTFAGEHGHEAFGIPKIALICSTKLTKLRELSNTALQREVPMRRNAPGKVPVLSLIIFASSRSCASWIHYYSDMTTQVDDPPTP
jgi:hypothetical protein